MAKEIGDYVDEILNERGEPEDWVTANQIVQEAELRLGIDRQKKYGHGNIAKHGEFGVIIRATDKLERLTTMVFGSNPKEALNAILQIKKDSKYSSVKSAGEILEEVFAIAEKSVAGGDVTESIEDSFGDLSNYGTYGVMLERGWWGLPLVEKEINPKKQYGVPNGLIESIEKTETGFDGLVQIK